LYLLGAALSLPLLLSVALILTEMSLVVSASILFSTMTTPVLASMFSLAFYIAGHLNDLLSLKMVERQGSLYPLLLKTIYYLLPNLEHFNVRDNVVYGMVLPSSYYGFAFLYGFLYTALFLFLSCLAFSEKDL
jgi:ABC-type transport system involved in multi-copper enzyme maturation permease subunit